MIHSGTASHSPVLKHSISSESEVLYPSWHMNVAVLPKVVPLVSVRLEFGRESGTRPHSVKKYILIKNIIISYQTEYHTFHTKSRRMYKNVRHSKYELDSGRWFLKLGLYYKWHTRKTGISYVKLVSFQIKTILSFLNMFIDIQLMKFKFYL